MSHLDDRPTVEPRDRAEWRAWLADNHVTEQGVWVVMRRRLPQRSGAEGDRTLSATLDYEAAVEEALCFGWIDGTAGRVDDERGKLYFARRKPRGTWAASNKSRVERLIRDGRMTPAGLEAIERAKANGAWEALDAVDRLEVPEDLAAALAERPSAAEHFAAFSPSTRRMALAWLAAARRPATRERRRTRIADAAARNERPVG